MVHSDCLSVTVIVTTRNRPAGLQRCLDGLLRQTHEGSWSIIVVDDASSNPHGLVPSEQVKAFQRRGVSIIQIRMDRNVGLSAARNVGIRSAKTELVAFLDDDEYPQPDWLRNLVKVFDAMPADVAGVGGPVINVGVPYYMRWRNRVFLQGVRVRETRSLAEGNSMFRLEILSRLGGFDPKIRFGHEGWDLYYRLRAAGYRLMYIPNATVLHEQKHSVRQQLRKSFRMGLSESYLHRKYGLGSALVRRRSRFQTGVDMALLVMVGLGIAVMAMTIAEMPYARLAALGLEAVILVFLGVLAAAFRPSNVVSLLMIVLSMMVEKAGNIVGEITNVHES